MEGWDGSESDAATAEVAKEKKKKNRCDRMENSSLVGEVGGGEIWRKAQQRQ